MRRFMCEYEIYAIENNNKIQYDDWARIGCARFHTMNDEKTNKWFALFK